ncbi:hypothetical protein [Sediminicoccus sp. KRV36]|uniref:hypothetical protein n=1 Tax=Sediminicoccus sp. KRV36 TaxID=3133721 RepID=UPI00200C871E|nr:hypothetical protein [Sediminicoccus rosea]UPY35487.1 hypothetical protein LHU95_14810 [Sediminicoccus rosea]
MQWLAARLREDSTRSGIGQLSVLVVLIALLLGVDVNALLTQAEASAGRILALMAAVAGPAAALARILTPQPPPEPLGLPEAAVKGLERLGALVGEVKP